MSTRLLRQIHLPYVIRRLADRRYIVLNRLYKPLGIASTAWVVYEAHPSAVHLSGLTPAVAKKLSFRGSEDVDEIYLYNDGCNPSNSREDWISYQARLQLLAELEIEEDPAQP